MREMNYMHYIEAVERSPVEQSSVHLPAVAMVSTPAYYPDGSPVVKLF
jgi:hypothetical protein